MDICASRLLWRPITSLALVCGVALMISLAVSPAAAQGTPAQRAACQDDAQRLCGQYVPNVDQITSCMVRNRSRLSARCRAVFDGGDGKRRSRDD